MVIMVGIFFFRGLPFATFIDFVTVPIFCIATVIFFNILTSSIIHKFFIALGKQSMNMWFLHALFATSYTAVICWPLLSWLKYKLFIVPVMILVSYLMAKIVEVIYYYLNENKHPDTAPSK